MNIFKKFIEFYKKEKRTEKAKRLILNSEICEELVQDLTHIVEEYPNTQIVIEPISGGKIVIKSQLTEASMYNDIEKLYEIPDIQNTISIAKAVRRR